MEDINKIIGLACEKGGYHWKIDVTLESMILDPLFWQALGKACGWGKIVMDNSKMIEVFWAYHENDYEYYALHFHEINLTQSWDAAITYLTEVTK